MSQELTTPQAAARLGVKPATLYAYVSRGLLQRRIAADGRTSLFDAEEIETFRKRRKRSTEGELSAVISSALTRVADGDLRIRGRNLIEMVEADLPFEQVADWLWDAEGPPAWLAPEETTAALDAAQAALPDQAPLIDRLRVTTAVASALDPLRFDLGAQGVQSAGRSLVAAMVHGLPPLARVPSDEPIAHRLWPRLSKRRPSPEKKACLNAALGLLVDHGMAASTFAARIAASTRADPYSIVSAALGVFAGILHGAPSGDVHRLLSNAERSKDPAVAIGALLQRGEATPGFGHVVYRQEDPRYSALMRMILVAWQADPRLHILRKVQQLIEQRTEAKPNIDLALGAFTWLADMAPGAGEAIFAIARTPGWIAHGLEEYTEPPLRFRPRARYTGAR